MFWSFLVKFVGARLIPIYILGSWVAWWLTSKILAQIISSSTSFHIIRSLCKLTLIPRDTGIAQWGINQSSQNYTEILSLTFAPNKLIFEHALFLSVIKLGCCTRILFTLKQWNSKRAKITIPSIPSPPTGWTNRPINDVQISNQIWRQISPVNISSYILYPLL